MMGGRPLAAIGLLAALAACAADPATPYRPGLASPGVGTVGGAAAGAAAGRLIAGENDNLVAILGGAAVGALAGNVLGDNAIRDQRTAQQQRETDLAAQQQLEYERQRQIQQAETDREIRERQEYEEWKRTRGLQPASPVAVTPVAYGGYVDVLQAQRYLTALGYYRSAPDGVVGPATRSAVSRFQGDRGLPVTGNLTPELVQEMRSALG